MGFEYPLAIESSSLCTEVASRHRRKPAGENVRKTTKVILNESNWEPHDTQLAYIEAWSYPCTDILSSYNYRQGSLQDAEVNDWLYQKGEFAPPDNAQPRKVDGGIRLLICERVGWQPLGFAMGKSSFLAIEEAFQLPKGTLPILKTNVGGQSYHFKFSPHNTQAVESLAITLKVPQMYQLGNYGLALFHSFKTGVTVAFLHGWNVLAKFNQVTGVKMISHARRIQELIQSTISLWAHPLLIPVILLEEHIFRASDFCERELSRKTVDIEMRLGVTHSGRLTGGMKAFGPAELRKLMEDEKERIAHTTMLNTTMTNTITFIGVLKWDHRYCQFLQDVCDQIREFHPQTSMKLERELNESIDRLACVTESTSERAELLKARLDLQLSVLYNFVAQADSGLNSRMAATAGLDSAAMKALAFVTTVFLPSTFVATLFSMSMFNWQSSSPAADNGGKLVVPDFWIYWVVSVPLTLVVLLGWRLWWHSQKSYYMRKYPHAREEEDLEAKRSS